MIYLDLFLSFFQIGLFSFGGGYAAMPLIQSQVVELHGWLSMTEFMDLVTISQMTPGPIAINSASFIGTQIAGLPGAIIATLGCIMPSCLIVSLLAWMYGKYRELTAMKGILNGLRPTVVALILSAGCTMLVHALFPAGVALDLSALDWIAALLFAAGLLLLRKFKMNPMLIMLGSGLLGGAGYLLFQNATAA